MLQNATSLKKSAPWPPIIFPDPFQMPHACHRFEKCYKSPHVLHTFTHKTASNRPKVVRTCGAFEILTSKSTSRHNRVRFFDISTSESGLGSVCVCVLRILTWTCASCHKCVQLFISHLARWLRAGHFSEPTFRLYVNHCKATAFRDFPTFSRACIFFLWLFPLWYVFLLFSSLAFSSDFLLWLFHLWFSYVHIVVSLTSEIPPVKNVFLLGSSGKHACKHICRKHAVSQTFLHLSRMPSSTLT